MKKRKDVIFLTFFLLLTIGILISVQIPQVKLDSCFSFSRNLSLYNFWSEKNNTINWDSPLKYLDLNYHKKGLNLLPKRDVKKQDRILCWVMTQPKNHATRVKAVINTWGKRCDKLLFVSSEANKTLNIVGFNITEGRNHLWEKTKEAFKYVYNNYINQTEWILKADDDTYIIMENLRHLLLPYNSSKPIWFGHRFKKFTKQGYMSGGAGYVLSREAVKRFVEEALKDPKKCRASGNGAEDAELGKCLDKVGVIAMDSRDEKERGRFFPLAPDNHLIEGKIGSKHWFWNYTFYNEKDGKNCCSDTAISFHYVTAAKMVELEYFIYNVKVAENE